jgi:5-formyltetrahydrofolate cyclo-ligase
VKKSELRREYLERQRSLSAEARARSSEQVAARFFEILAARHPKLLHCFVPIEKFNELDTGPIFHGLWKSYPEIQTVVPRVNFETGEMESVAFSNNTELVPNRWGIREPSHSSSIRPDQLDMVLVPGLCFDARGHRVGYGKGFYDRFLIRCRPDCVKIGLSYFKPVPKIEDAGPHDILLDHLITPHQDYGFGS